MTNYPVTFKIEVTLQAPFNTAGSAPDLFSLDQPLLRDHRGRVCLPSTLLQGRILEEVRNWGIENFPLLVQRMGKKSAVGSKNNPLRKTLVFDDMVLQPTREQNQSITATTQTRIQINQKRGAVEKQNLQVIETAAAAGAELHFTGQASAFVSSESEAQTLEQELLAAFNLIPTLGSQRSIGMGQVLKAQVRTEAYNTTTLVWPDNGNIQGQAATAIDLHLQLDRPWVVTDFPSTANGFESGENLAGNVLKGAFANTCQALGRSLPPGFDDIVFNHAFCAATQTRPRVTPDSMIEVKSQGDTHLCDIACYAGPTVFKAKLDQDDWVAPLFTIDWKTEGENANNRDKKLDIYFGRSHPARHLRVRTAIESDTRAAAENQLFSYEMALHEYQEENQVNKEKEWQPHTWIARLDLSALNTEQQNAVRETLLNVLRYGLHFVGKTKAIAHVTRIEAVILPELDSLQNEQTVLLTLQSPALLTAKGAIKTGDDHTALHQSYADSFCQASHGALALSHYYARQCLRGGSYQHHRFATTAVYEPWLLTEAGAVFALKVKDSTQAKECLKCWLTSGLPVAQGWSKEWRCNPYLPQNGFGEVVLNDPCHKQYRPQDNCLQTISLSETSALLLA